MTSKSTTYARKGGQRERCSTQNMARIPGVVITNKETRDLVRRKKATGEAPAQGPSAQWDAPESQAPHARTQQMPPASPPPADDFNMPTASLDAEPLQSHRPTQGIETRAPIAAPSTAGFQPPWAASGPEVVPLSQQGSTGAPRHVTPATTLQQFWIVLSCEVGGSEVANLPGIEHVLRVPIVRVEGTFGTHDEAFATAARLNREHAPRGKVYSVSVGVQPRIAP